MSAGPDGGAFTTAPDMAKFWQALANHQLLEPETTQTMLTPHIVANPTYNVAYGYGVWLYQKNSRHHPLQRRRRRPRRNYDVAFIS